MRITYPRVFKDSSTISELKIQILRTIHFVSFRDPTTPTRNIMTSLLSFPMMALALLFFVLGAHAKGTCINVLTDVKVDKLGVRYETGRKKGLWVGHSDAYQCGNTEVLQEQPQYPSQYRSDQLIIAALLSEKVGYFDQITKKGCIGDDGVNYCCEAGLKSFDIVDAYVCEKSISESNDGSSQGKLKMTYAIEYSCNQEARRKSVALRFNAGYKTACQTAAEM